jgi:hypothetical protein
VISAVDCTVLAEKRNRASRWRRPSAERSPLQFWRAMNVRKKSKKAGLSPGLSSSSQSGLSPTSTHFPFEDFFALAFFFGAAVFL